MFSKSARSIFTCGVIGAGKTTSYEIAPEDLAKALKKADACLCGPMNSKPLAMVPGRTDEVHKARLQALQRVFSARSDGNVVKVSCRITVEPIQQAPAGLFSSAIEKVLLW